MKCPLCDEDTELAGASYCPAHQHAFENIKHAYDKWTVAHGNLTLPDFLERVQKAPGMGAKAKEIALFLTKNPARWK